MKTPITLLNTFVGTALAASLMASPSQAAPLAAAHPSSPETAAVSAAAELRAKKAAAKKKAQALKKKRKIAKIRKVKKSKKRAHRVLVMARTRKGSTYRSGSMGPRSFDCSGLTSWAYKKVGKKLPRTSRGQARYAKRTKNPRKGDLVFFHRRGRVYHVGIYAGNHHVFHASRPGVPVKTERIWTNQVFYGRAV